MERYVNRQEAGRYLADQLTEFKDKENTIVLALPRGGVPVGYEIAKTLHLPLDVFIVRKIGVPKHEELAMGALAEGNIKVFNTDILNSMDIPQSVIDEIILSEQEELNRRAKLYRGGKPLPPLEGKTVILVDDGVATGATLKAAIQALRQLQVDKLIVAVPVAQKGFGDTLTGANDFICPLQPTSLQAVGLWFNDFSQTEDDEVIRLLSSK